MNNNSWFKKEKPMLTLPGLGGGSASNIHWKSGDTAKSYIDDVFSTYVYKGSGTTKTINNGIDLAGKGGMVWLKGRETMTYDYGHGIHDTVRGRIKNIQTQSNAVQADYPNAVSSFNSDGFSMGDLTYNDTKDYASWTFRKQPGFFDIVTWTGNGTARTLPHALGCVPGMIIIKNLTDAHDWVVYHKSVGPSKSMELNNATAEQNYNVINSTLPTASVFSLGTHGYANDNGKSYVAYLFAGGESTDAAARSVDFGEGNTSKRLDIADTTDLEIGSSQFTMECWFKQENNSGSDSGSHTLLSKWDNDGRKEFIWRISEESSKQCLHWLSSSNGSSNDADFYGDSRISNGTWNHGAVTRDSSGKIRMFVNGILQKDTRTQSSTHANTHEFMIGANGSNSIEQYMDGSISNVRFIKGQCLWTSSFIPTNEPLTTTSQGATASNVKLLCCNNSSTTGSNVTPGTITAVSSPTASTDSPFDDPAGFVFGENGDQGVIKVGSYLGQPEDDHHIHLGWEPQWLMVKNATQQSQWLLIDTMRGTPVDGPTEMLFADINDIENSWDSNYINVDSTGFYPGNTSNTYTNYTDNEFTYVAIRRPDGYVGKPPELATDVFTMDYGNSLEPTFDSGFPVDFALLKRPLASSNFLAQSRLSGDNYLFTNSSQAQVSHPAFISWDSNAGWAKSWDNGRFSWMWKRHAGFDVVLYDGNGASERQINHGLGKIPEMMWLKPRDSTGKWNVYHKGVGGGTNPEQYYTLFTDQISGQYGPIWNNTAPTATHFTVGNYTEVNDTPYKYMMMLFASVEGISKVGYYAGTGSNQTLNFGFNPRLIIIKQTNSNSRNWHVFDTLRGIGTSNDPALYLSANNSQYSDDFLIPASNGITITPKTVTNESGGNYIYYAHA
jgi:hypothetical protein